MYQIIIFATKKNNNKTNYQLLNQKTNLCIYVISSLSKLDHLSRAANWAHHFISTH